MLVVINEDPQTAGNAQEGLEAAAVGAAFGMAVSIALLHPATPWLASTTGDFSPPALIEFGVTAVYLVRGHDTPGHPVHGAVTVIGRQQFRELLASGQPVLSF